MEQRTNKATILMDEYRLFAVTAEGPKSATVPFGAHSIHQLLANQPAGVYTALRSFQHIKFLLLDRHLSRLEESMAKLGWDYELDQDTMRKALHLVCNSYPLPDCKLRIDVLARPASGFEVESRLFIAQGPFIPLSETVYTEGVQVGIARHLKRPNPKVKSADFVNKRRSFLEDRNELFEALLVDDQGYIMEGTSSNFFAIDGGVLLTSAEGVLEGTARSIIIEVAKEMNLPIRYEAVHTGDVNRLSECAISSSSRDIVPVVRIDDQVVGSGRPGQVTRKLLKAYRSYVEQIIMPAYESDASSWA